jgi:hypothetical protein
VISTPADGSVWIHAKSGKEYRVLTVGRTEKDGDWVVIYHRVGTSSQVWTRSMSDWYAEVELHGGLQPRFYPSPVCAHLVKPLVDRELYGDESKFK